MIFIRIFPVFTAFFTLSFTIMFNPGIGQTIPVANFTTSDTGCTGSRTVDFQDLTSGSPDQWFWNFGDNNTDTVQNPSHTYSVDDTFTVTLVACNMMGCDTVVKNIILKGPLAATCFPNATYYCCLQGIYNVTVGAINNTTSHDSGKYKNYSCNFVTTLTAGQFFSIEIETGPSLYENVRAWIDFNDDALFDTVNEKVFESLNKLKYHSGLLYLPDTGNVKTGRTLRMRVGSDNVNWPVPEPCTNPRYGQFEDYGIIIKGKSIPPTANFTGSQTVICLYSTITFTDLSGGFPDSWYWDFGDTTTSTLKNPSHTYTDTGIFTVSLVSFNQYGSDTMLKTGYIRVLDAPIPSCIPPIINSCCGTGIYRLLFATIDNITGDSADWYSDFTCEQYADVLTGGKYSISVETGPVYSEDLRAWIDYNNDGIFSNQGELVLSSNTLQYHNGIVRIPAVSDTNISLRMRIASDYGSV
ncbi:MAG: PKD domain-containing protein, partial [Bacteroidetes bacterium]|nr:PKD domain-containing protein [Bacteroidota bacterium]